MNEPMDFYRESPPAPGARRTAADLAVLLGLLAALVLLRASAPSNTYSYAQFWQVRASIDQVNGGSLVMPKVDSTGSPARKPQLYAWLLTAAMKLTGLNNDFIYRVPTLLSAAGLVVLIYLLGRRWYDRRAGLFAGALWITMLHMNKMAYLATTDMLLAFWIAACVFCADRLAFHPAERHRWVWTAAFWVSMILAGLSKAWGLVNLVVLGGWLALAGGLGPGFLPLRDAHGLMSRVGGFFRMLGRRWWALIRRTRLGWGLVAMLAVFVPLLTAKLYVGGEAFLEKMHFEVLQRITGQGEHAPHTASAPAVLHLLYNTLPASIFAASALLLVPVRGWLGRRGPIALPMWWIITVVLAFSIPAGFRPDYLLPCYAAVALQAGWAARELARRWEGRLARHPRRICTAVPIVLGGALVLVGIAYLLRERLPLSWAESLPMAELPSRATWMVIAAAPAAGIAAIALGVWAIRRRRMGATVAASCLAMLMLLGLYAHLWSRQARTADGQIMRHFARRVEPIIGRNEFMLYNASKLGTEVYLGRFGEKIDGQKYSPREVLAMLRNRRGEWLITSDFGLAALGAYEFDPHGEYRLKRDGHKYRFAPRPEDLGELAAQSIQPIEFENWGRIYLIRVGRIDPSGESFDPGYISDPVR
jgi:4-amino-4-deoxy-L-arabinose transferase-like glycosyltransferase